ncbi:MAG: type III-A CRISPR-associated RAMP protein Csm5 [Cryomorphaceae bacterium]|nr:type III-A CRISPR-associated RAMP protein Csm5 [Cryomorphaceae bacterium]
MNKNNITLEVISPVHIGGTQENHFAMGMDVFWENGKLYRISINDLEPYFDNHLISQITAANSKNEIHKSLRNKGVRFSELARESWSCPYQPEQSEVKAMLRDGLGKKLIPGSSIKGALRSHLFRAISLRNTYIIENQRENVKRSSNIKNLKKDINNFEKGLLNVKIQTGKNRKDDMQLLRFLHISDFSFTASEIYPVKIYNLKKDDNKWGGAWKHANRRNDLKNNDWDFRPKGFVTHYEALAPNFKASGRMVFNKPPKEGGYRESAIEFEKKYRDLFSDSPSMLLDLFSQVNLNTSAYLEKEIAFFKKYFDDDYIGDKQIVPFYNQLKSELETLKNACIFRLGSGSGFHSVTGDWLYKDHISSVENPMPTFMSGYIKNFTKSRKLAFQKSDEGLPNFYPMGFIKLSINAS